MTIQHARRANTGDYHQTSLQTVLSRTMKWNDKHYHASVPVASRNKVSLEVMSDENGKLNVASAVLEP
jgi:hypothetical protein